MTEVHEIEELLKDYGLTLDILPKPITTRSIIKYAHDTDDRVDACKRACEWASLNGIPDNFHIAEEDFICHQSEVIELLIAALQCAKIRWNGIHDVIRIMSENILPITNERAQGFFDACHILLDFIEEYKNQI